ncbi:MAG: 2-succinyl-5-enolpyruvyl-6-hydroxy-3-cyclohexene-1-carboxylic-acid synthase [Ekhidna sp.]|uniref:2-succinyl-5-enolpyruvyl-6-hydroxy-3- cyclohexene-1-carboxylic-acid synthase n=1 Tax=Ekhidna sp. TaxID=2608089 RepID=UPI0032EAB8A6
MLHPTVFNTSQICRQLGIMHAVMSPGSRNAPLTISFARHSEIKKWIIPDERAAGFIALGIAQERKEPVVLCCTSGTALLNYAPAIAEAYYRQIPLIVLSADRPPELIDQRDGQTIRQFEVLKNHVKASYQLPIIQDEQSAEDYQFTLIEGIQEALKQPVGPVHLNIPFAEPFYPTPDQHLEFRKVDITESEVSITQSTIDLHLGDCKKILILIGQQPSDEKLKEKLMQLADSIPVIKSPLNNLSVGIDHVDGFIDGQSELKPDLLITSGLSVLSKKLKAFIRNAKPARHIHFDPARVKVDTYSSNPQLIKRNIIECLDQLVEHEVDPEYVAKWKDLSKATETTINDLVSELPFSEPVATLKVLKAIPANSNLHLSNSMPVRYADLFGVKDGVEVFSNRGTSGIDGCTSTALGTAMVSKKLNVLITGDLAFLYDRNAFFHNHQTPNLQVIIMNNQGGGIFRLIPGPSGLPELEDYFETRHNRTAEYICKESNLNYSRADNTEELEKALVTFFESSEHAKVLEIYTQPEINDKAYKELRTKINERINN